jgi:hypothetical protein
VGGRRSASASAESSNWNPDHLTPGEGSWAGVVIRRSFGGRCSTWSRPAGRSPTSRDLGISAEAIYNWRRQDRIDRGLQPGRTSAEKSRLTAAKRRFTELEAELAIHRRASEMLGNVVPPKTVRGHRSDGRRGAPVQSGPSW